MRVVVRHPATPPVDFDFVLELDPKPAVVYHVCERAVPGRITVFDSDRFALGWCPSCQENVRELEEGAATETMSTASAGVSRGVGTASSSSSWCCGRYPVCPGRCY